MPAVRVSSSESALSDLQAILEWYADEGVSEVGDRFVFEIFERVEVLALHPDIGRVVPEFGKSFLRELVHPPFRMVYRRDAMRVRVVRICRSARLPRLPPDETKPGPRS